MRNSKYVKDGIEFNNRIKKEMEKHQRSQMAFLPTILGKIAYFDEYFKGSFLDGQSILLEEIKSNERLNGYFNEGYKRAQTLVNNGFTRENYLEFLKDIKKRYGDIEHIKRR